MEDEEDNRQIIRNMLAPTDYQISEVEDGQQALEAIAKQQPDLILMDIQLPIMDGYEAALNPDHRSHVLCAQRRRKEGAGSGLRRLCAETFQPAPTAGEDSAVHAPIDVLHCCTA